MSDDTPSPLNNVITIDDERIKSHLDRVVRGTVEEPLNALLNAEADRLCNAQRYERSLPAWLVAPSFQTKTDKPPSGARGCPGSSDMDFGLLPAGRQSYHLSFSADSRHLGSSTLPTCAIMMTRPPVMTMGVISSWVPFVSRVRTTVPSCMWWFERDQCNSSSGVGRLSL
jgi:hypothetical protein